VPSLLAERCAGLRRFSTSAQCRLETKGFHALGLGLNHEQTQGDFPLPPIRFHASQRYSASTELKLLSDETHDRDIDSGSSSLARSTIYLGEGDISTGTAREIGVDTVAFPTLLTHSRTSYMVEGSSCRGRPEDSIFTDIRGSMGY
jgi:hypothetical protein